MERTLAGWVRAVSAGAGGLVETIRVLIRAGLIRAERPDRLLRCAIVAARFGPTPAGGVAASAIRYPREAAVIDDAGTLNFDELHRRTNAIADSLATRGVRAGDSVAIMCRNSRGFVEAVTALSKLGVHSVLLNTGFAGPQAAEVVEREDPSALIYDEEFGALLSEASVGRSRFVISGEGGAWRGGHPHLHDLAAEGDSADRPAAAEPARVVILTSGTTGTPKGASRPNPGGGRSAVGSLATLLSCIPLQVRESVLIAAPLFHSWGFGHLTFGLPLSSTFVLRARFDPEDTLATLARERCRTLVAVPVMLQRILELPKQVRGRYDLSALEVVAVSGSALPGDLALRFMDEFGDVLYNLYGSTEVAWAAVAGPGDLRAAPGTAGRPPRGTTLRILAGDGTERPRGSTGRIFVSNDLLFNGYTGGGGKEVVAGLMSTGDVGWLDDEGRLFVEGRDDEMIVSGGENVFPREVEDLLATHPQIIEAAAIQVSDCEFGQRLKAFVVARDGDLGEEHVKRYVRDNLARYKVPRDVVFLAELPRNASGKVLKRELE